MGTVKVPETSGHHGERKETAGEGKRWAVGIKITQAISINKKAQR